MGLLNISLHWPINAQIKTGIIRWRECSKKHALSPTKGFVQSCPEQSRGKGRSPFDARSVLIVREHGKRARTPLAAPSTSLRTCFFSIP